VTKNPLSHLNSKHYPNKSWTWVLRLESWDEIADEWCLVRCDLSKLL
jgi:hypothetical protein